MTPTPVNLSGRIALVTGGGTGIGRSIALALGAAGATVGIHYFENQVGAEETLAAIRDRGGKGTLLPANLMNPEMAIGTVDRLVQEYGGLDILINNAGSPVERVRLEDCSLEVWNQIIATNLTSAFVVTQRAIPHLRVSGKGAIVNNLTLSIQTGGANGAGPYAIAKGGLQVMTRTLARELSPHVRVNSIMPGVIETRHHQRFTSPERMQQYRQETPLGRNGMPDEVAAAVLMLVSDAASFITGALIDINGGRFLR